MIISEEMLKTEASYKEGIESQKLVLRSYIDEMNQFYKEVADELNDGYKDYIDKLVRVHVISNFTEKVQTYEGFFGGFDVKHDTYIGGGYNPVQLRINLFKVKKDGTPSKQKYDFFEKVTRITKIELI